MAAEEKAYLDSAGLAVYNTLIRGDTTPLEDGTPSTGTSSKFARADHVHPPDSTKVDKVTGKGLSTEDYTSAEKTKLAGIAEGAEENVQSDWNASSGDAFIKNKPTKLSEFDNDEGFISDYTETDPTVPSWAKTANKPSYTAGEVGAVATTAVGQANGVASLDSSGKVPSSQLPSFVDDVIEAYPRSGQTELSQNWLATGSASGTVIVPESGKIYVLMADSTSYSTNTQFRWGGTAYVKLNDGGIRPITSAEIQAIVNA